MQRVPSGSVATWGILTQRTSDAQDPTFHSRQVAFASRQLRAQEGREAAIAIGAREPGGDAMRIMLIGSPALRPGAAPVTISERGLAGPQQIGRSFELQRLQMIQIRTWLVRWPRQARAMEPRALDHICLSFMEKANAELVRSFRAQPKRAENPIGEMSYVISDNGVGMRGDGDCNDMEIVRVG